jgi:predicted DNA-binding ribbon-helix-helix protein
VGPGTLKQRAHQLSVYLEAPVYDALRDIAHAERTKLHPLILEGIDMVLKKRGAPSIKELTKKAG